VPPVEALDLLLDVSVVHMVPFLRIGTGYRMTSVRKFGIERSVSGAAESAAPAGGVGEFVHGL
jgi:hypothetical protein